MSDLTPKTGGPKSKPSSRARTLLLVPALFLVIVGFLAIGLTRDPRAVPSPLIGKAVPAFDLPPVKGRAAGLATHDFGNEVVLLNVFASWCVPCRVEHPVLISLQKQHGVPIYGLNYKDKPDQAAAFLDALGDPYARTGADIDGRVGIDWGVYGVPETFVIDRAGRIAYKHIGPLTSEIVTDTLLPLVRKLRQQDATSSG